MRPSRFVLGSILSLALALSSRPAEACPETPAPAPTAAFSIAGEIVQSGASIVRFSADTATTLVDDERVAGALVGFSPDGRWVIALSAVRVGGEDVPPCARTHTWVRLYDLTTDGSRRIARLRGGRPTSVSLSPTGRYVTVGVSDGEASRLHLFDLETGRRKWVTEAVEATWLDEAQLVLRDRRGRLSLHRRMDGERVRVLSPPARRMRPFAEGADGTGFWATTGRGPSLRFVRVRFEGARVRVDERGSLSSRPLAISAEGARGAFESDDVVEVRDLASGELVATIRGRPVYRRVALSADGAVAITIGDGNAERVSIDGSASTSWGTAEPPSEVLLPEPPDQDSADAGPDAG